MGGKGGTKVVPARYLVPHPPAFEVEVTHFSTMKDIIQDRNASLAPGGSREFPVARGHVAGYAGFQPRCPPVAIGPQEWVDLNQPGGEGACCAAMSKAKCATYLLNYCARLSA